MLTLYDHQMQQEYAVIVKTVVTLSLIDTSNTGKTCLQTDSTSQVNIYSIHILMLPKHPLLPILNISISNNVLARTFSLNTYNPTSLLSDAALL
jgi:hypothetical protein